MDNQLQDAMNQAAIVLIEKAMSGIDSATGFLQAEIPEYVYQLMLWYGVKNLILFFVGVAIAASSVMLFRVSSRAKSNAIDAYKRGESWTRCGGIGNVTSTKYDTVSSGTLGVIALIVGGILSVCFMSNILDTLQILIAPKVWLVEYASVLIK